MRRVAPAYAAAVASLGAVLLSYSPNLGTKNGSHPMRKFHVFTDSKGAFH